MPRAASALTCSFLTIGGYSGSSGTYSLSGSGYLAATGTFSSGDSQENVGYSGGGTFAQSGGTNRGFLGESALFLPSGFRVIK